MITILAALLPNSRALVELTVYNALNGLRAHAG